VNDKTNIADAAARTVDGDSVSTDLDDPVRSEPDVVSGEAETFAAAVGLTPPISKSPRRLGKRKSSTSVPESGRPLVTATSAAAAANYVGGVVPTVTRAPDVGPQPQTNNGANAQLIQGPTPQAPTAAAPAPVIGVTPVSAMPEKVSWIQRRRMRARRVRRTIRHIDPWSVFKISLLLFVCLYIAVMAAGVLLWNAAVGSGIIDNFESFMQDLGFETWELVGDEIFRGATIIGLVLVAASSALSVVMAILFNLISDLTGGVRVTVIEEDLGRRARQ